MTTGESAYLFGMVVSGAAAALAADRLLDNGRHTTDSNSRRPYLFAAFVLLVLLGGFLLALVSDLPAAGQLVVGLLALATGSYITARAYKAYNSHSPAHRAPSWIPLSLASASPVLLIGAAAIGLGGASAQAVPPPGTIINATTGDQVAHVVNRTTPQDVQILGEVQAADITTGSRYTKNGSPLRVHIGDIVEFSTSLFSPDNHQVPFLEMYAKKTTSSRGPGTWMDISAHWPTRFPDQLTGLTTTPTVEVIYPRSARLADLTYIPGSSRLFGARGDVLAQLPDGIMESGIALTNVGAPPSCSYCETEYLRYVNFKVQVTNGGRA